LRRGTGALLCLDIKELASINARLGRSAGDLVITSVVKVLHGPVVREFLARWGMARDEPHSVFRIGGDEFVAIFPNRTEGEVNELGQCIDEAFRRQVRKSGIDVPGLHFVAVGY